MGDKARYFAYAINEFNSTVTERYFDAASGRLDRRGTAEKTGSPVCILLKPAT